MTPTHVICPKVDGLPEYLTAGKRYEVEEDQRGFGGALLIADDTGLKIRVWLSRCPHLNGADWIPVYGDDCPTCGGTGEVYADVPTPTMRCPDCAQPNWNDLGPRMLEALRGLCGLAEMRPGHLHEYVSAVTEARALIKEAEAAGTK